KFREILSETIDERVKNIEKNLYDEAPFQGTGEFDYVQEGKGMCESCGGEMREGECSECGYRNEAEIMELGGMEDGHPRFGNKNLNKMTRKEKEDLMSDRSYEMRSKKFDDDFDNKMQELCPHCNGTGYDEFDDVECQWCDGTGEYDEYGDLKISDDMPSYKTKYRYNDDEEITEKLHGKQHRLDKNKNGRLDREDFKMLRKQQDEEEQLYEVEFNKEVEEGETDESREFAYAAMMAKKKGKDTFELDGETFDVKESILYTESDLLDLIESLVLEEKRKFKVTEPKGYREYERAHKADKKENDDYLKSVAKKMTDYLKKSSDSGSKYEMKKTKKFPTENGGLKKGIRKKYTPSDAVDDYIDAFSYPGQTNLVFDEIKPTEKNIEKYLKGHRTTGNAQVDDDGNALGNVVPSETGEKFFKNFKDNLYGQEQMDASYKRQPQPVDQAGEETERGSLKSKRGKKTSQSVLNKLEESIGEKSEKKLSEEFGRMHELMGYNRKTQ
ncbi:MAG: hypothetical protein EBS55_12790, partial [Flavobacteriaceae bacterium]|nr:hypothetical protein [Flavobacteriaceae bacterium]